MISQTSDAELRARYDALVLPHLDRLLAFARRRADDDAEAEDAVQEACIRAWMGFADLRDPTKVRPWLYRILRGVLSDGRERETRRRHLVSITRLEDAHEAVVAADDGDAVFSEVAARITGDVVRAALGAIPEDFAAPVELHDIDGFKYHEIADILAIPIGTVMSRISRGRRLLAGAITANQRAWALATPRVQAGAVAGRGAHD
jgi:RNA polymerase sigma-70 factor (ECF subfamily)